MSASVKYYIILNIVVLIWGFTGVLGDQISLGATQIVFFRMGIAFLSLAILKLFISTKKITPADRLKLIATGFIVGAHWFTFFYSIKISTVSIGVVCMSSSTLFTAILEPLIFKKKHERSEFLLGLGIIVGIWFIFGFEPHYTEGIIYGIISAFLASLFNVLNGQYIQKMPPLSITLYEMLGGLMISAVALIYSNTFNWALFDVSTLDWVYLLILGIICTTLAFMVSVWIMKFLSPFTVSLSINMEPVYAILIALIVSYYQKTNTEQMSVGFYIGTLIILGAIFINAYLKKQQANRLKIDK